MPNGHIASKLQEVNLYKQNAMLARATYVNSRNNTYFINHICPFADLPEEVETIVCIVCPAMGIFCIIRLTESGGLLPGVV